MAKPSAKRLLGGAGTRQATARTILRTVEGRWKRIRRGRRSVNQRRPRRDSMNGHVVLEVARTRAQTRTHARTHIRDLLLYMI